MGKKKKKRQTFGTRDEMLAVTDAAEDLRRARRQEARTLAESAPIGMSQPKGTASELRSGFIQSTLHWAPEDGSDAPCGYRGNRMTGLAIMVGCPECLAYLKSKRDGYISPC